MFEAVDTRNGAAVALKVFFEETSSTRSAMQREFASGRALRHPNVIKMLDWVHSERDALVTELIDGRALSELIASHELSATEVFGLARGILEGLAALHDAELLHRDLKPSNVLVRASDGIPILIDLGLAKSTATDTTTRALVGTPVYWPPEVASGKGWSRPGDVYAYGRVVLSMIESLREDERNHALLGLVRKCLSPFPEERFADAKEALAAFPSSTPKRARRRSWILAVSLALVVTAAGVLGTTLFSSQRPAEPAPKAAHVATRPTMPSVTSASNTPTSDAVRAPSPAPATPSPTKTNARRRSSTDAARNSEPDSRNDVVVTPGVAPSFVTD